MTKTMTSLTVTAQASADDTALLYICYDDSTTTWRKITPDRVLRVGNGIARLLRRTEHFSLWPTHSTTPGYILIRNI